MAKFIFKGGIEIEIPVDRWFELCARCEQEARDGQLYLSEELK